MSFFDCLNDAMDEGSVDLERGKRAQQMWKDISATYERQGHPRHLAEVLAGEDVKAAFKKEAGDVRNRTLGTMAAIRRMNLDAAGAKDLVWHSTTTIDRIELERRAILRQTHGRISQYLKDHHPDLLGRVTKPAQFMNVIRELHGEQTGDASAKLFSDAILNAREDLRRRLNAGGHNIGLLENRGLRHTHNRLRITRAGFDTWAAEIAPRIDWTRMTDHLIGKPFQGADGIAPPIEVQARILGEVYDNLAYGHGSKEAVYGRRAGSRPFDQERVLHFKSADDWFAYNKVFGSNSPFDALIIELEHMSRELAITNHLGPDKASGIDYLRQVIAKEARKRGLSQTDILKIEGNASRAKRMLNVVSGGAGPQGYWQHRVAAFFSNTRKILSSAMLDRAVVISVPSDMNSMRLAAMAIKLNPSNVLSTYFKLMTDAVNGGGVTTDDLLRQNWIADSLANPGVTHDRFSDEWGVAQWASVLSNATMRIQGLNAHTDNLRLAFQHGLAGHFASYADKPLSEVEETFQTMLRQHGISEADWDIFRQNGMWTAPNGATFLNPLYWREAVDHLDPKVADDVFLKFQSFVEDWTEKAVPTGSAFMKGMMHPTAYNLPPGTIGYEFMQSMNMFKSFPAAFMINQVRMMAMKRGVWNKTAYALDLLATSTLVGALGIQANELLLGRDPQDMTKKEFFTRAFVKGGGAGPLGDIITAGQSSFGGGIGSWLIGPIPGVAQDLYDLTGKNIAAKIEGKDAHFAADISKMGKRYLPMGQTLAIGPAIDRLFWDQLQLILDPESADALAQAAKKRSKDYGSGFFWSPGSPLPDRMPNLGNAIGQ